MKKSQQAKRMERNHKKMSQASKLNLTALMDIFTILVFFLMVNSSTEVQVLKDTDELVMPKSVADKMPEETLIIQVTATELIIQGRLITDVESVMGLEGQIIPELDAELKRQTARNPEVTEEIIALGRPVTIQGHNEIPYKLLKKVMTTCAKAEYRAISLAVSKIDEKAEES